MSSISSYPIFLFPRARMRALMVVLLRCVFFIGLIAALASAMDLGSSTVLLSLAGALGIVLASALGFSRLSHIGFITLAALLFVLVRTGSALLYAVPVSWLPSVFSVYTLQTHAQLMCLVFGIGAVSTWVFWRWRHAVTVEVLFLLGFVLYQVADYRNFNFKVSQTIGSAAWFLGVSHLTALIGLGLAVVLGLVLYLYCATLPGRPTAGAGRPETKVYSGRTMVFVAASAMVVIAGYLYTVSDLTFRHFHSQTFDKNGVGMGADEKMSPLDFHSALGGTNQPSGLVRLDGDYNQNPFSPMLYLREAALSEYDGNKIVRAERIFDADVSNTSPDEAYLGSEDAALMPRTPLTQSVYLLAEHKSAFAVDYPVSIDILKNPNPKRFKASYRAYSIAPAFSLDEIRAAAVGDQRWSEAIRAHYVRPHSDPRYKELAERITQGAVNPVEKAFAIVEHLNKNAIYTLAPGHEVKEGEDPVAPFLFGDMRGYCVHFAHATVYMLRALGIPSRIGTGYLTDLSQSKDGHILLRMSDRHAWAEVFIDQRGWVPFDTKPEQVESHAETPVDMKLLEELMDMLGPDEEVLPKDIVKDEKGVVEEGQWDVPGRRLLAIPLAVFILLLILTKLLLLYGWVFVRNPGARLKWGYRALLTRLYGIGARRNIGETRSEFQRRIAERFGTDILAPTDEVNRLMYSRHSTAAVSAEREAQIRKVSMERWSTLGWWKRVWACINPAPVFFAWVRGKW